MKQNLVKAGFAVLLGLAVVVPLLNYHRVNPMPTFYSELAAAALFLSACAVGATLLPRRQPVDGSFAVFCLGLLAILAYQVLSGHYYEFLMSWVAWAAFLCLFFLVAAFGQLATTDPQLRLLIVERLSAALVLVALFNAFAQIAQVTELALSMQSIVFLPTAEKYSGYLCAPPGNVAQRNHANIVAWLGIAGLTYSLATRRVRLSLGLAGIAVLLFSSALTSSRMAWLMAIALACLLLFCRIGIGWTRRRALFVGVTLLVGGLLTATVLRQLLLLECMSSLDRAFGGFGVTEAGRALDYWVRLEFIRQAVMAWWSQPILGVGVGKFMATAFALEPSRDYVQPLDFYPHNTVLEILLSFGVVGLGLFAACAAVWISRAWRERNSSAHQWLLLAGLVIIGIPALLELSLWYLYFLLPFALMLGMSFGPRGSSMLSVRLPWRLFFPVVAIIAFPLIAFAGRDHLRAERVSWLSYLAGSPSDLAGSAAAAIPKAVEELTIFKVWGEHELLRLGTETRENLPSQMAANKRLMNNILSPHIVARQVMLETLSGRPEVARDLFRRMMVFFPEHYESLADELRKRAIARGGEAQELLRILDEETVRPPRGRGRS